MEDGEKEDTAKEEEQAEALWADVTKRKKRRCGQKVEKPEAFMANFFKGLEIYQTKLLVSTLALSHSGAGIGMGRPQRGGRRLCLLVLPHLPHPSSLLFLMTCLSLLCWREEKAKVLATQSCLTLCDPMDCSLPGSSVYGIQQEY